jgi:hypothetical protein
MQSRLALLTLPALLAFAPACGGADDRPARWSFISAAVVEPACATVNCHSHVSARAGVDLHARDIGYYTLVNELYVIPGDPAESALLSLLNAQGTRRMPPDAPLPQADIDLIAAWIAAGATND